jgi:hypothetical protein
MARNTPALLASLRHGVEDTDSSLRRIATEHEISLRTLYRIIVREEWKRRSDRPPRDLPPALAVLNDARALLAEENGAVVAAVGTGAACRARTSAQTVVGSASGAAEPAVPAPAPAPPSPVGAQHAAPLLARIARVERLLEQRLAAEEAVRVQLGTLPGARAEAERAARTLASLTQTLHVLARLRASEAPDHGTDDNDDDDMPRDLDEFRRDLARRIDAWAASRTGARHAGGDSGAAPVDAV